MASIIQMKDLDVAEAGMDSLIEPTLRNDDQLLVAFETTAHTYQLGICPLPGSAGEKMKSLKAWRATHFRTRQTFMAFVLCKKPCIAIGSLGHVSHLEAQTLQETQFEALERNETLSRGFTRPDTLIHSADMFVRVLPSLRARPGETALEATGRHVLVVALETDRVRVALVVLFMALLGFGAGIGVAVAKHDWGLGAGVGGSVFAFVAVLQGALVLVHR